MDVKTVCMMTDPRHDVMGGLAPSDRLVALLLARFRNHITGKCCPSQGTLSRVSGLARETVCRCIRRLVRAGVVKAASVKSGVPVNYELGVTVLQALESSRKKKHARACRRSREALAQPGYKVGL